MHSPPPFSKDLLDIITLAIKVAEARGDPIPELTNPLLRELGDVSTRISLEAKNTQTEQGRVVKNSHDQAFDVAGGKSEKPRGSIMTSGARSKRTIETIDNSDKAPRGPLFTGKPQGFIDQCQQALDNPALDVTLRLTLLFITLSLIHITGLYPSRFRLQGVTLLTKESFAGGSFSDVYYGLWQGRRVSLKSPRSYQNPGAQNPRKRLLAEATLQGNIPGHPNTLPSFGIADIDGRLYLVSPLAEGGDGASHITRNPGMDRHFLALGIARGLKHLHDRGVIHRDLKLANIFVGDTGIPVIGDYGHAIGADPQTVAWTLLSLEAGSVRWQAPELYDDDTDESISASKASDIFALGNVFYEIFTDRIPLFEFLSDGAVMYQVAYKGKRPSRPDSSSHAWSVAGLTEAIWTLMENCWTTKPAARPTIDQVIERLEQGWVGTE